jgi:protein-tyrosine phosphatase
MIDLHCHLLPGIDDGPQTLDQALELARAAVADGITHSVLTAHVHPGRYPNQRQNIEADTNAFRQCLAQANIPLKVSAGGEARLCHELVDLIARNQLPFLGEVDGFKIALLEFPHQIIPVGSQQFIQNLLKLNIRPLIAHPERNKAVMAQPKKIDEFAEAGCWLQLTSGSLTGRFGNAAQKAAFTIIEAGWYSVLATDAHNIKDRPPLLCEGREALRQHFGDAVATNMVTDRPAKILGATHG